jgi:molecular chaperone GrpE
VKEEQLEAEKRPGAAVPPPTRLAGADTPRGETSPEAPALEPGPPLSEFEVLRAENSQLQDRFLRLAAEYDNFRKRSAREWQEQKERAAAEVLREMLELADNLERALGAPGDDAAGFRKGVELIAQQLQLKLRRFGVEPLEVAGQPFDPQRHEAVLVVDAAGTESQHVVDVVQRGYTLRGEVLRPARVTVAR